MTDKKNRTSKKAKAGAVADAVADATEATDKLQICDCKTGVGRTRDYGRELLTANQCAEFLTVSFRHVYALQKTDGLPLFKVGCGWRVFKSDLVAWLQAKRDQDRDR